MVQPKGKPKEAGNLELKRSLNVAGKVRPGQNQRSCEIGANKRTPSPKKLGTVKMLSKLNSHLTSKLEADTFSAEENINKPQAVR